MSEAQGGVHTFGRGSSRNPIANVTIITMTADSKPATWKRQKRQRIEKPTWWKSDSVCADLKRTLSDQLIDTLSPLNTRGHCWLAFLLVTRCEFNAFVRLYVRVTSRSVTGTAVNSFAVNHRVSMNVYKQKRMTDSVTWSHAVGHI